MMPEQSDFDLSAAEYGANVVREGMDKLGDTASKFSQELGFGKNKFEMLSISDFTQNFNELSGKLSAGYTLSDDVFSNGEAVVRASEGGSLNTLAPYVEKMNSKAMVQLRAIGDYASVHKNRGDKVDLGGVALDKDLFFNSLSNSKKYVSRDQMFAVLVNGSARMKALLREDDTGIPLAYSTARGEVKEELRLIEKAAVRVYESPTRTSFSLKELMEDAKKGFGAKTKTVLGFGTLAVASCVAHAPGVEPTVTLPTEIVQQPTAISTPEIIMTATTEVFGGGEFGIVKSNETDPAKLKLEAEYIKGRKEDARKHLDSLLKIDDQKMDVLRFGVVIDGKVVITDELLNVENPVNPAIKNLYLLSQVNIDNNLVKDVYSPLMMDEANGRVVYIDLATGEQKVWMQEIPGKPGWSNYYPNSISGEPMQIQMDLHSSASGGAKNAMVAYVNKDAMLPIKVGANGLEYSIGDKTYRLDIAQGKWVEKYVYSADVWGKMDQTAKDAARAKLPQITPEGYTKGAVSEVKDYLQKYYGTDGKLAVVYNFETGTYMTPEQAGVKEFVFPEDGYHWEMPSFSGVDGTPMTVVDVQRAIDFIDADGAQETIQQQLQHKSEIAATSFWKNLPGFGDEYHGGVAVTYEGNVSKIAFGVWVYSVSPSESIIAYWDGVQFKTVNLDKSAREFVELLKSMQVFVSPTK